MMAMTTSSSIRVNPRRLEERRAAIITPETEEGIRGNAKLYHTDRPRKGEKTEPEGSPGVRSRGVRFRLKSSRSHVVESAMAEPYKTVVGLEVHVQLLT